MSVVHDQRQNQIKVKEENSPIPILPQPTPPTTTLIITTPLNTVQSSSSDPVSTYFEYLLQFLQLLVTFIKNLTLNFRLSCITAF